jgi:hypothetical protein
MRGLGGLLFLVLTFGLIAASPFMAIFMLFEGDGQRALNWIVAGALTFGLLHVLSRLVPAAPAEVADQATDVFSECANIQALILQGHMAPTNLILSPSKDGPQPLHSPPILRRAQDEVIGCRAPRNVNTSVTIPPEQLPTTTLSLGACTL